MAVWATPSQGADTACYQQAPGGGSRLVHLELLMTLLDLVLMQAAQDGLITDVQQLKAALQRELHWRVSLPTAERPHAQPAMHGRRANRDPRAG